MKSEYPADGVGRSVHAPHGSGLATQTRRDVAPHRLHPGDPRPDALPMNYHSLLFYMVAKGGIEPPTRGFSVRCSTD